MSKARRETNLETWNNREVASYYSSLEYLTPCERLLFDEFLKPEMAILDLGVGGGRTTPHLASLAGRYIGADYAAEMIVACRKKFPALQFEVVDASDLSAFAASTFDAVVMAFNTLDNVIPDESRRRALKEVHRVLKPSGILIFSSHNARAILVRPSWNPQRLVTIARRFAPDGTILFRLTLAALTGIRAIVAVFQAILGSAARLARRLPTRSFWRGEGYLFDPDHGGASIHLSTPEFTEQELSEFSFRLLRVLGDDYPRASSQYFTDWYYYVFQRQG